MCAGCFLMAWQNEYICLVGRATGQILSVGRVLPVLPVGILGMYSVCML